MRLGVREAAVTEEVRIIAGPKRGSLELVPNEVSPGDLVTLKGDGFEPNAQMQYLLLNELDLIPYPKPRTNRNGVFEAAFPIPSAEPGPHELRLLVGVEFATTMLEILPP